MLLCSYYTTAHSQDGEKSYYGFFNCHSLCSMYTQLDESIDKIVDDIGVDDDELVKFGLACHGTFDSSGIIRFVVPRLIDMHELSQFFTSVKAAKTDTEEAIVHFTKLWKF